MIKIVTILLSIVTIFATSLECPKTPKPSSERLKKGESIELKELEGPTTTTPTLWEQIKSAFTRPAEPLEKGELVEFEVGTSTPEQPTGFVSGKYIEQQKVTRTTPPQQSKPKEKIGLLSEQPLRQPEEFSRELERGSEAQLRFQKNIQTAKTLYELGNFWMVDIAETPQMTIKFNELYNKALLVYEKDLLNILKANPIISEKEALFTLQDKYPTNDNIQTLIDAAEALELKKVQEVFKQQNIAIPTLRQRLQEKLSPEIEISIKQPTVSTVTTEPKKEVVGSSTAKKIETATSLYDIDNYSISAIAENPKTAQKFNELYTLALQEYKQKIKDIITTFKKDPNQPINDYSILKILVEKDPENQKLKKLKEAAFAISYYPSIKQAITENFGEQAFPASLEQRLR